MSAGKSRYSDTGQWHWNVFATVLLCELHATADSNSMLLVFSPTSEPRSTAPDAGAMQSYNMRRAATLQFMCVCEPVRA